MPHRSTVAVAAAGLLAVMACAYEFFALRTHWNPGFVPVVFTPETWAAAGPEERGRMADDLLASRDLRGMTRDKVAAMLGPPDADQTDLRRFRYHLGRRGRNPDAPLTDFSLLVRFDEGGKVVAANIAD